MSIWRFRKEISAAPMNLAGFSVEAVAGRIGEVEESIYEPGALIIDTGFWIFGNKRMVPASVVDAIDWEARSVHIAMTKEEVRAAPDYDSERHDSEPDGYHKELGPTTSRLIGSAA